MEKGLPDWRGQISEGNFRNVKHWLVKNVHSVGNLYSPPNLIKNLAGKELTVPPYLSYLYRKYSRLYDF